LLLAPQGQEFFRSEAKPPFRFWDRAGSALMTAGEWIAEGLLVELEAEKADASPPWLLAIISICLMDADEQRFGNAACAADKRD